MSASDLIIVPPDFAGTTIIGSPAVERGTLVHVGNRIYFHRHIWYSGHRRKPHGRSGGVRRKWRVQERICDDGFLDKIRNASEEQLNELV